MSWVEETDRCHQKFQRRRASLGGSILGPLRGGPCWAGDCPVGQIDRPSHIAGMSQIARRRLYWVADGLGCPDREVDWNRQADAQTRIVRDRRSVGSAPFPSLFGSQDFQMGKTMGRTNSVSATEGRCLEIRSMETNRFPLTGVV